MYQYKTVINKEALDEVMEPLLRKNKYRIKLLIAGELILGLLVALYMASGSVTSVGTFLIYAAMTLAIAAVLIVTSRKKYASAIERAVRQNLEKIQKEYHTDRVEKSWLIEGSRIVPQTKGEKELSLEDLVDLTTTENYILASFAGKTVQIIEKSSVEGGSEEEFAACLREYYK